MLFLRSFINLFFVPCVALFIMYKKKNYEMSFSMATLLRYCMITAVNIPLTRIITMLIRIFAGKNIEADDSYYTVAALVAAAFLPYLYDYICSVKKEANNKDENGSENMKKTEN